MLKISRKDVSSTEITEFTTAERYIKLPIEKYLALVPSPMGGGTVLDQINAPQIALINAINGPKYRFVCAALSRRLGKTFISNIVGQMISLVPGSNILIMSPNYSLSTISFELQRKLINTFDLEIVRDNLKDRLIELSNGSTIRMGSINQVDSCVGRSYDLILFDEAALSVNGDDAFNVSLRPTMDKPNSKAIFISTPRGKRNWFSTFFSYGFSEDTPDWCSIQADYTENPRMKEADVASARKVMSVAEFEQEYMASFNSYEGQIYPLPDSSVLDELPPGNYEFFGGLDPGYRDPTAFVVIGYNTEEEWFCIVEDYLRSESTTAEHANAMNEIIARWRCDPIFIDSAAAQFASDLAYQYDIATINAKKQVLEGIAYCQTLVQQGRLKVLRKCSHVIDSLDQYQWDPNEALIKEKPLHNNASHIADAIRYALYTFTP